MPLTDIQCKNFKPEAKLYKKFDGGGLHLVINPSGSKLWRLKYNYLGTEKTLSIGAYDVISLKEAREITLNAKKLLSKIPPEDPSAVKKQKKREARKSYDNTFRTIALEWYETKEVDWSTNYAGKVKRCLDKNILPFIGERPITEITTQELIEECLKRVENRGSYDIAKRTGQFCNSIFRFAVQRGKCKVNIASDLRGAIRTTKKEHYKAIQPDDIPDFIRILETKGAKLQDRTLRATWLSLHVFCRPGEIRQARWEDIDLAQKKWTIPAEFMKQNKEHVVPLSTQVIELLEYQKEEKIIFNSPWVFPSQNKPRNPMSDGTVNKALKTLGYGGRMVAHGFRALARTAIREKLKYDSEYIEKQLSHMSRESLGEAYDRTQHIEERIQMMQDWSDYLEQFGRYEP